MPTKRVVSEHSENRQKLILLMNTLRQEAAANGDDLAARLLDDMARLLDAALASSNH